MRVPTCYLQLLEVQQYPVLGTEVVVSECMPWECTCGPMNSHDLWHCGDVVGVVNGPPSVIGLMLRLDNIHRLSAAGSQVAIAGKMKISASTARLITTYGMAAA